MATNVELEFISKLDEISESMLDLAVFWNENEKALEDANVSKDYPFSESFNSLALNMYDWLFALINSKK